MKTQSNRMFGKSKGSSKREVYNYVCLIKKKSGQEPVIHASILSYLGD
jgi:hypothetical protein